MDQMKAIVFTHFNPSDDQLADANAIRAYINTIIPTFKAYLLCDNLGLVYVYVSRGIEMFVRGITEEKNPDANDLMVAQQRATAVIETALWEAIWQIQDADPKKQIDRSKFIFVGVSDLSILVDHLLKINKRLLTLFAGGGKFTYDSPKFIEAVIRIVRGTDIVLCRHPIIRIDADVMVDSNSVGELLTQFSAMARTHKTFWFFSGGYAGAYANDYVNKYAVRAHWLVEWNATTRQYEMPPNGIRFLRDLGEIGATQLDQSVACSPECATFLGARGSANRPVPQVISGAGLVMSLRAILRLPPFMNAKNLTVWIDDHLKRRLHEAIGDIASIDVERLPNANFLQNRHLEPIDQEDLDFARDKYFERLLRGCLVHRAIVGSDGTVGPLARLLKDAIGKGKTGLTKDENANFAQELFVAVNTRLDDVLGIWSAANYGTDLLRTWAIGLSQAKNKKDDIVNTTVEDMVSYAELFFDWHFFTEAILRLHEWDAPWLFRDPV